MTATDTVAAEVGTILCSLWGYDQTNVTFYEIVRATPKTVTLREIASRHTDDFRGRYRAEPIPGDYTGNPFRRYPIPEAGRLAVSINSYAIATEWEGNAVHGTNYA